MNRLAITVLRWRLTRALDRNDHQRAATLARRIFTRQARQSQRGHDR